MNGKHSVHFNCPNIESRDLVAKSLVLLGYKNSGRASMNADESYYNQIVKYANHFHFYLESSLMAQFTFDVSKHENLDTALAISAIQNDNEEGKDEYHKNEWVVLEGRIDEKPLHTPSFSAGKLYELGGRYFEDARGIGFRIKEDDRGKPNGWDVAKYHKASPEEIIKFFKEKYNKMENKKVIGYKLLKPTPTQAAGVIFKFSQISEEWEYQPENKNYKLGYTQKEIDEAIEKGFWFEPVYENIFQQEILVLGSKALQIVINSRKEIRVPMFGTIVEIDGIRKILSILNESNIRYAIRYVEITKDGHSAYINDDVRFLRIGCEIENNLFSLNELSQVISVYDRLNS